MSRLLDDDQELSQRQERELTLSAGAILGIFLGLVLLCGLFFGFGYNLGRKSTTIANAAVPSESSDAAGPTNFDNFKAASAAPQPKSPASADTSSDSSEAPAPSTPPPPKPAPATTRSQPAAAAPPRTAAPTTDRPAAPPTVPGGEFVVQVAAISHKDDADLLVSALRAKGYSVTARPGAQDKLLHIQVGPYATKAEAEDMRKRLLADGYNAILK